MFKGKFKKYNSVRDKLNNKSLKIVNETKYLGITISENLNLTKHIENITSKCSKELSKLLEIAKKDRGLNKNTCTKIYKG